MKLLTTPMGEEISVSLIHFYYVLLRENLEQKKGFNSLDLIFWIREHLNVKGLRVVTNWKLINALSYLIYRVFLSLQEK